MSEFATIEDIESLWRVMSNEERERAEALLPVISDSLRQEAKNVGKDLDQMITDGKILPSVVKSVVVDVVARTLITSTNAEPMIQSSQSAMGYSYSGTYLVPGGGLFIKKSELARLGLRKQRIGVIEML
jgi:hypothetical protein